MGWHAALVAVGVAVPAPLTAAGPAAGQSETLQLTAAEMFRLAEIAGDKGDLKTVSAIYAALEQNPDADIRAEARFRYAKQLTGQKHYREAAVLLRRVLDDKPDAAGVRLQLARLLQLLGDSDAALRELRAAQASGLPPAVARMVDRYSEALRAGQPAGGSFEIGIAPDNNINRGTRSDTLGTVLGDFVIEEEGKAKSGIGISVRGQAYRRFALGKSDHKLLVQASGFGDLYGKSRFNSTAADIAAGPEFRLGRSRVNLELGATQRWFGQKPFVRSARIGATFATALGRRNQLRLSSSASLIDNQINDLQDGRTYSAQLRLERALSATTGAALSLGGDRQSLKEPAYSTIGWRAGVLGWKSVGRATLTVSAEVGRLEADERLLLLPEQRRDRYSRLTVGATLRQLSFMNFAPVVRFTIERNKSTVEFYDYSRTRSELAIVRAF